jgi:tetratricopeptide (TPR) repeat protein
VNKFRPNVDVAVCGIILALLTAAVYLNTLGNGFVWDDWQIIVENPLLKGVRNIPRLLLSEDTFPGERTGYYRPVTYVSFLIDRMLWGGAPLGYHLTNLLLHLATVVTFFLLLLRFGAGRACAFCAAALFAVHPVNSETVNFLAGGRNTLLSALFTLLTFYFFLARRRTISIACYGLAVFSKEFALLLPPLLWLYDRWVSGEKRPASQYVWYLLPAGVYLVVRSLVVTTPLWFDAANLAERLATVPRILAGYGRSLVYLELPILPRLLLPGETSSASYLGGIVITFIVVGSIIWLTRGDRYARFAFAWLALFLVPVLNIVPLGPIPMADRYAYFSSMGFCLVLALAVHGAGVRGRFVLVAIIVAFSVFIVVPRNRVWHANDTLYAAMIADAPHASMGYQNLGLDYFQRGDVERARSYLEKAVSASGAIPKAYFALGSIYWDLELPDRALEIFKKQVAIDPGDFKPYTMASRILRATGDTGQAELFRQRAHALEPEADEIFRSMAEGRCIEAERLQGEGRVGAAEKLFRSVIRFEPDFARAHLGLGSIIAQQGKLDEAIAHFYTAARLEPQNPTAYYNLSLAYRFKGDVMEAKRLHAVYRSLGGSQELQ